MTAVAAGGHAPAAKKVAGRPTEDEEHAAKRIIALCREVALEPPLLAPKTRADPRVVACGLALYFGEKFASEAKAKEAFGLGASTEVRRLWAQDKLVRLFEQRPAARKAAAVYFPPIQTTHADDCIWNDDEQEQEASPSTALVPAASTSDAEPAVPVSSAQHDADAYARGYEAGLAAKRVELMQAKFAVLDEAKKREDALEDELSRLRQDVIRLSQKLYDNAINVESWAERVVTAELQLKGKETAFEGLAELLPELDLDLDQFDKWNTFCDAWFRHPSAAEVRAEVEKEVLCQTQEWGEASEILSRSHALLDKLGPFDQLHDKMFGGNDAPTIH